MTGYYELRRNIVGQYYFNLRSSSAEIILTGHPFVSRQEALNAVTQCRALSQDDSAYVRMMSAINSVFFLLKTENYEILGKSPIFTTTVGRDNCIDACKAAGGSSLLVNDPID